VVEAGLVQEIIFGSAVAISILLSRHQCVTSKFWLALFPAADATGTARSLQPLLIDRARKC